MTMPETQEDDVESYEHGEQPEDDQNDALDEPGADDCESEADDSDDADEDAEDDQGAKKPGVRERLSTAEARVAELEEALSASRWSMFHHVIDGMGLSSELMQAAGMDVADFLDEHGDVDVEALMAAADAKRGELGLPRKPRPNAVASRTRQEAPEAAPTDLGGILREHVERAGVVR